MILFKVQCISRKTYLQPDETGNHSLGCYNDELTVSLTLGKIYEVLSIERGYYRIIDDTEEDYLYPSDMFVKK